MITDIDLIAKYSEKLINSYITAVDFIHFNPEYSLVKFREIISNICNNLLDNKDLNNKKLFEQIDLLYKNKTINQESKTLLHEIRKTGNIGAHINHLKDSNNESIKQHAELCRSMLINLIISLIDDEYLTIESISFVDIDKQKTKEVLFNSFKDSTWEAKFRTAIIYEGIAKEFNNTEAIAVPTNIKTHQISFFKAASSFFEAAYKLSADFDNTKRTLTLSNITDYSDDDIYKKFSAIEPLYKYGSSLTWDFYPDDQKNIGYQLLESASERGYIPATSDLGIIFYENKNYHKAYDYLVKAANQDDDLANIYMYYYFSDKDIGMFDKQIALSYLYKAIELGSSEAITQLAIAYHEGVVLEKNIVKSEELLNQAIKLGNMRAKKYYKYQFNDNAFNEFQNAILEKLKNVQDILKEHKNKKTFKHANKKILPNEQCPCGSGKKYKKCCG